MVLNTNLLRRRSPRLLSAIAPVCRRWQQQQQLPQQRSFSAIRTREFAFRESFFDDLPSTSLLPNHGNDYNAITTRSRHSSTQIKRLFKKNPAKRRIALKQQTGLGSTVDPGVIPESSIPPTISERPKILSNGWNVPASVESDGKYDEGNELPFRVARTKNKPNNAVGFLPVYSEHRKDGARVTTRIKKVSGDRGLFLNELRAALEIPIPKNPREDTIRIRTGGTIEIKGNRVLEVKTWLAGLGF